MTTARFVTIAIALAGDRGKTRPRFDGAMITTEAESGAAPWDPQRSHGAAVARPPRDV
jgi:hypothetical protein